MPKKKIATRYSHDVTRCSLRGYGTWQAAPGEVGEGVYLALKAGYRHLVSVSLCCAVTVLFLY
jgi:diketogulonate reductase-like aldo/keto reductase